MLNGKLLGIYRGEVIDNEDPLSKGRIKVFVPGVNCDYITNDSILSSVLQNGESQITNVPWAYPAMPLFGGSFTMADALNNETGICSVPHKGAFVFVFFEDGDINYPVYFAAIQSGDGWFSSHPDEHVLRTNNVEIKIDDTDSNETLYIQTKGTVNIVIDGDANITSTGAVNIVADGDANITSTGTVNIVADGDANITSTGTVNIDSSDINMGSGIVNELIDVRFKYLYNTHKHSIDGNTPIQQLTTNHHTLHTKAS